MMDKTKRWLNSTLAKEEHDDTVRAYFAAKSLRDYFAGMAMQVLLYHRFEMEYRHGKPLFEDEEIAASSYRIADALLKERDK